MREFYLGFSGLLYGWFFYGALKTWRQQTVINALVLVYLSAKLFTAYFVPSGLDTIGGLEVAKEMHGLNSVLAVAFWVSLALLRGPKAPVDNSD